MKFKTRLDKDRSCLKVFPDICKYRNYAEDREIVNALSELKQGIDRHIDDVYTTEEEYEEFYMSESGNEYGSLFDALIGEISTDIYGYYRFEYTGSDGGTYTDYADDFKELCCEAYYHADGFRLCDSGTDKLTEDQASFINQIIAFRQAEESVGMG